jgi:transposase
MLLTPGNTNDHKAAVPCVAAMSPSAHLIADKGYNSAAFRDWLRKRGATPVIPPRKSRKAQNPS